MCWERLSTLGETHFCLFADQLAREGFEVKVRGRDGLAADLEVKPIEVLPVVSEDVEPYTRCAVCFDRPRFAAQRQLE